VNRNLASGISVLGRHFSKIYFSNPKNEFGFCATASAVPQKRMSEAFGIGKIDFRKMVAEDGIEPPTQGFSVLCSTD
jgi:hypothetical protein